MYKKLAALLIATVTISSTAFGQLYKADYATKLVLAGTGGPGLPNTITLTAPAIGPSFSLTLPATVGSAGYILTTDGTTGQLSWTNPAVGVTLAGDVTGAAGSNTVVKINGTPLGSTTATTGNLLIANGGMWVSTGVTGDVTISGTGVTTIGANKVQNSMLRQSGALSVIGRSDNSIGDVADISGATDNVLRVSTDGTTLGFGQIATGGITDGAVTSAKILDGTIVDGDIAVGTIANDKLANNTISITSTDGSLTVPGSPTALGGTANVQLDMTHENTWLSVQAVNGTNHQLRVDNGAQLVVDQTSSFAYSGGNAGIGKILSSVTGNGDAEWVNLSSLGVSSVKGTADEIYVNGDATTSHVGPVTLTTPQPIGTTSDVTFGSATLGNLASNQPVRTDGSKKLVSGAINLAGGATEVSGILPVANGGTNSGDPLSGSSIMISNGSAIVQGEAGTTTTVLHGNNSGAPSYSSIVDADIADNTISNGKLQNNTITMASPDGSLTVPVAPTALGGTADMQLNTAHSNSFSATQGVVGVGRQLRVDNGAQLVVDGTADFAFNGHNAGLGKVITSSTGNGDATWTDLSSIGVTAIKGTANQVLANNTSGTNQVG
ncbi:MAG TPA: hypothetical protein VFO76_11220, partial [Candidatus Kapabacteria bacterium]|nr:hypothetical protein [Candidatus Kapabacteria bacterium]